MRGTVVDNFVTLDHTLQQFDDTGRIVFDLVCQRHDLGIVGKILFKSIANHAGSHKAD